MHGVLTICAAVFVGALGFTLALVPACRWLAPRLGLVDRPTVARKIHGAPVPYLGGVSFFLCLLLAFFAVRMVRPPLADSYFGLLIVGGAVLFAMGLYDDMRGVRGAVKLLVELVVCVALCLRGLDVIALRGPLGGTFEAGYWVLALMVLWVTGVTNAVNFADGSDGLAAGTIFIGAAAFFAIAFAGDQATSCLLMACLMGTTLGFLAYNFHPASIFMGDAGSLVLGFVFGGATLVGRGDGLMIVDFAVPGVILAIPLFDTVLSLFRRIRRTGTGAFFVGDGDHIHHRLLALGMTQRQLALGWYAASACMGLAGFVVSQLDGPLRLLGVGLVGLVLVAGEAVLRSAEGRLVGSGLRPQAEAAGDHPHDLR